MSEPSVQELKEKLSNIHEILVSKLISSIQELTEKDVLSKKQSKILTDIFLDENTIDLITYERNRADRAEEKANLLISLYEAVKTFKSNKEELEKELNKYKLLDKDETIIERIDLLQMKVRNSEANICSLVDEYNIKNNFYLQNTLRGF